MRALLMMALVLVTAGALVVAGVATWSVGAALIVAGLLLAAPAVLWLWFGDVK